MDSLFHFIFSIIAGMAIGIHQKHKLNALFVLAFSAVIIDIDHIFGMEARGTLHNIFVVVFLPLAAFLFFFRYENRLFNKSRRKSIKLQTYSLLLFVMLAGHVAADTFYEGEVKFFYPLSAKAVKAPNFAMTIDNLFPQLSYLTPYPWAKIISTDGIALLVYAVIIMFGAFAEDFIYFFEKKHESFRRSLKDAIADLG